MDVKSLKRTRTTRRNQKKRDDDIIDNVSSADSTEVSSARMVIVANQLPLKTERRDDDKGWSFSWNEDSLLFQMKDGFREGMKVFYVGSLKVNIHPDEQDEVSHILLNKFSCIPTFVPPDILEKFYDGFCKRRLWPLFHYMLPFPVDQCKRLDRPLWEAYAAANRLFFQRVLEVLNPKEDYVWIHDYHLMAVPSFLRRNFLRLRMGFFLHTPFPSSEIYRTLSVREEILMSLLNCDVIGFHTYDYAHHFLSCCSQLLGLEYQLKTGFLELTYHGRTIRIKILPVGIHMGRIESVMKMVGEGSWLRDLKEQFSGKRVLLGVDDMDIFKGINLKLLAMEQMLKQHPDEQGRTILIQIMNPERGKGIYADELQYEIRDSIDRINKLYEGPGYKPIILIDKPVSIIEKFAYYSIAECLVVTSLRDGMNLSPYEYIACRQGMSGSEPSSSSHEAKKSMLVISEFIGCSLSLSGALCVNPWNIEAVALEMYAAISMNDLLKQSRHTKHYNYISTHDVVYWSSSFLHDMDGTWFDQFWSNRWGVGFGFDFMVVSLDFNFRKLPIGAMITDYKQAQSRAILLNYDGTVIPLDSSNKSPSEQIISALRKLCADKRNVVFIVSGRGRDSLSEWFGSCKRLGIAAEHGFFLRWPGNKEWEDFSQGSEMSWMRVAEPIMELYTKATDGSSIERKERALVWKYRHANSQFGSSQAKDILVNLECVLANEPVTVESGKFIVEVKLQGVDKGIVAETIFKSMAKEGKRADFVLCIGDDRSDEDMFEMISKTTSGDILSSSVCVFACTVGQKPSKAKYYLEDTTEVVSILEYLAGSGF